MNVSQLLQQNQMLSGVRPAVSSSSGNSSTPSTPSSGEATITANDFLTLLVSELKNQDPTANTDPNEYVDQLVQVNSLQQLISINTGIGSLDTAVGSTSSSGSSSPTSGAAAATSDVDPAGTTRGTLTRASDDSVAGDTNTTYWGNSPVGIDFPRLEGPGIKDPLAHTRTRVPPQNS